MNIPLQKILIANRGEIACRIMRTCREMGIATVAVYSDADAQALHVEIADQAVHIGPPSPRESYLQIDKIIAAAKASGAVAIHPGYGFLSENEDFAEACAKAGIVFIGPPASAILAMGGKSEAKALMEKAGVPLVPGYHGDKQDPSFLAAEAEKIGYPVLIKASAGGGGKGMRIVESAADFAEQLAGAQREAQAAFGDQHVLIEKYLAQPRHVEIQVFADSHGNTVYLFERDCSVQRRHQKVIEEAPAPGLTPATRKKMGEAAVAAARAIGYVGAGTVEFLLDDKNNFYFMEMNTRLQVEHPVTEMITGLDLVELQIRVAAGETLPFTQDELEINGHAVEVRIYAEDPANNFLPGAGQISYLRFAPESADCRIDTGVREYVGTDGQGDVISIHYDPMIAKLIVWGEDRDTALDRMKQALDETAIAGPKNNLNFLRALASHKAFRAGEISTGFIKKYADDLLPVQAEIPARALAVAALGILKARAEEKSVNSHMPVDSSPWSLSNSWRNGVLPQEVLVFEDAQGKKYPVTVAYSSHYNAPRLALPDGKTVQTGFDAIDGITTFTASIEGTAFEAAVVRDGRMLQVMYQGHQSEFIYNDIFMAADDDSTAAGRLTAPMPGKVVALRVAAGDNVKKGQPLVIVEAMKMEHTIVAPTDGVVEKIHAGVGTQVDEKFELIALKTAS